MESWNASRLGKEELSSPVPKVRRYIQKGQKRIRREGCHRSQGVDGISSQWCSFNKRRIGNWSWDLDWRTLVTLVRDIPEESSFVTTIDSWFLKKLSPLVFSLFSCSVAASLLNISIKVNWLFIHDPDLLWQLPYVSAPLWQPSYLKEAFMHATSAVWNPLQFDFCTITTPAF